jgi:hypothetical protein
MEDDPDYWRQQAARCRIIAAEAIDAFVGERLLSLAQQYDELAKHLEDQQGRE